jgi:hypothetical protein
MHAERALAVELGFQSHLSCMPTVGQKPLEMRRNPGEYVILFGSSLYQIAGCRAGSAVRSPSSSTQKAK